MLSALHRSDSLRAVSGQLLRPGGFQLTERGVTFCAFTAAMVLADVGCGNGATLRYLRDTFPFKVIGFDSTELLVRECERDASLLLVVALAEALPVAEKVFNGVLCECVLSLIEEPERVLAEIFRVLRPGGFLIITDLYDRRLEVSPGPDADTLSSALRSRATLETLVVAAGFSVRLWEDHSRCLKELVAQMLLSNVDLTDFCDFFSMVSPGNSGEYNGSLPLAGYFLLVAQS
jgi:arsenite methyltransferase